MSATTATLSTCRWDWCTRTFSDDAMLRDHVENDHIASLEPVKRKDVPMLRRVEDGTSQGGSSFSNEWSSPSTIQRVERGVMTEPDLPALVVLNELDISSESLAFEPAPDLSMVTSSLLSPKPPPPPPPQRDDGVSIRFSDLRGTPSPAPASLPPSPGTGYIVDSMKREAGMPVASRLSPRPSPRASPQPGQAREVDAMTPVARSGGKDDSGAGSQEAVESLVADVDADALHELDQGHILPEELHAQWEPQSQLPLPDSLEDMDVAFSPTIDPTQLHALARERGAYEDAFGL